MKRTMFVMAVVLGFATAASAATLSLVSNQAAYNVGDTITLTVSGDDAGAFTYSIFGRLNFNAGLTAPGTSTQNLIGAAPWSAGPVTQGADFAEAFNQIDGGFGITPASNIPGVVSIVTMTATAAGILNIEWANNLSFYDILGSDFGGSGSPGLSITIIPEPTTAVMLGLGLLGLGFGGRRRS